MTNRENVLRVIDESDNLAEAAITIYKGPKAIAVYAIQLGLETVKSKRRRVRRRELRAEVRPQFKAGRTTGSVVLTAAAKDRLVRNTRDLFGDDGWMIGDLNLGNMTKEQLVAQAEQEKSSAKGSLRNAQFYAALAEPLAPGQRARDYWKPADARRIKSGVWRDTEAARPSLQ